MGSQDYEEFIAALNAHEVRYLIVGAHAVALHARPRATNDLDVLIEPTIENANRVLDALRDFFGGTDTGYAVEDFTDPNIVIQLGVAPVRIDILSGLTGLDEFHQAWQSRVEARFAAVPASFIGRDMLIQVKEAADREQDRADVAMLRRAVDDGG